MNICKLGFCVKKHVEHIKMKCNSFFLDVLSILIKFYNNSLESKNLIWNFRHPGDYARFHTYLHIYTHMNQIKKVRKSSFEIYILKPNSLFIHEIELKILFIKRIILIVHFLCSHINLFASNLYIRNLLTDHMDGETFVWQFMKGIEFSK